MYYHYSSDQTDRLLNPGALLPYKDTLLLIANEGFVTFLDITKFPPLPTDFRSTGVPIPVELLFAGSFGNNSICASNPAATEASLGMSFISME